MFAALSSHTTTLPEVSGDYWQQSRRPLASLAFMAPLLLLYEIGVLVLGSHAVRNGADVWLRQLLDLVGFSQYFLLPLLTVAILLAWHHLTRQPWRVSLGLFYRMLAECAVLAVVLVIIARVQDSLLSVFMPGMSQTAIRAAIWDSFAGSLAEIVGYVGAGVYEELLFRLMMLPVTAWLLKRCGCSTVQSLVGAIAVTSLLFAAAHHIGPEGEPIVLRNFLFRTIAGVFFATLFVYRGFGIAAGTHALYDILVSVWY
ncbi:MAG: CPBP family intramembrane glutamic endopeptidase [Pirellulales bacterium]